MNISSKILKACLPILLLGGILITGCDQLPGAADPTEIPPVVTLDENLSVIAEGRLVPREFSNLFFPINGEVIEVLVKEGDQVEEGDPLIRLNGRESYQANLAAANLEQISAQQQLDELNQTASLAASQAHQVMLAAEDAYLDAQERFDQIDTDAYQDDIDAANSDMLEAETDLKDAQEEFDKYQGLDEENADRKAAEDKLTEAQENYNEAVRNYERLVNDLTQAEADMVFAEAKLEDARLDYEARQNGPDPDELALVEARLSTASAQVAAAQAAIDMLDLVAPYAGTVVEVNVTVGERILPNQTVLLLADLSEWYVETIDLTENEVVDIQLDQAATIVPDALLDLSLDGRVEAISQVYSEHAGDITYLVRIRLDESDERLRWGMTVDARFDR